MDPHHRFASLPSVYISDRNNNAIRVIQSPTLAKSLRTQSFRCIEDSYDMKIHHKHRRRSSSDIGGLHYRRSNRSKKKKNVNKRRGSCPTGGGIDSINAVDGPPHANPYNRFSYNPPTASVYFSDIDNPRTPKIALLPFNFFTKNPSKRRQKWVDSYFKEQPQFQSTYYFISLKLQELLHITSSDVQPSSFRVAMACELLCNFIEKTNSRRDNEVLMKRILRLIVDGVYPKINAVSYHDLIGRDSYFKKLQSQEEKLDKIREEFDRLSQETKDRFSSYFIKTKQRRSLKPEFAVWRTYAKVTGQKRMYEIRAQRAVEIGAITNLFWKWRHLAQIRKQRLLRETESKRIMVQNEKVLTALKASRRQTLALQAKQYKEICKKAGETSVRHDDSSQVSEVSHDLVKVNVGDPHHLQQQHGHEVSESSEDSSDLATCWPESPKKYGLNLLQRDQIPQPENWRSMLLEYNIMRMNLKYYKRISENRNVFIDEFQRTMETRLHLEICRDRLEDYLREYESQFGRLHHSSMLMTDEELDNPWDEQQHQSPLGRLSSEKLLLRWINHQIRGCGDHENLHLIPENWKGVHDLATSFRDGRYHWLLLKALNLIKHVPDRFNDHTIDALMDTFCELGLNDGLLVTALDIKQGNAEHSFVFLSNLMTKHSSLYLEPGHLAQDLEEMDQLYAEIEGHLSFHDNYQQFAFSESWLKKATTEREKLVALCLKCETIYEVIESDLKMLKALDAEFSTMLQEMQWYALKILSADRRGMKVMIEDEETEQEMKQLTTIDVAMFSTFYKLPKSVMKLTENEQKVSMNNVVQKCELALKDNLFVIRRVFNEYSGRGGSHEVLNGPQLKSFCVDMRIVSTFSNYQFDKRTVLKKDFATFLTEVCYRKHVSASSRLKRRSFANTFREFMSTLWESTKTLTEIRSIMAMPQIQSALQAHRLGIQQIFRKQSEEDKTSNVRFITKKKWGDLMHMYGAIGPHFTDKMADQTFEVCNSDYLNQGEHADEKMIYQEFVEALLAVALMKNSNIFSPMSQRVKTFFKGLIEAAT